MAVLRRVKERYVEVKFTDNAQKPGLRGVARAIAGNRPLFILHLPTFLYSRASQRQTAIHTIATQYVLNDPILLSSMGFLAYGLYFYRF